MKARRPARLGANSRASRSRTRSPRITTGFTATRPHRASSRAAKNTATRGIQSTPDEDWPNTYLSPREGHYPRHEPSPSIKAMMTSLRTLLMSTETTRMMSNNTTILLDTNKTSKINSQFIYNWFELEPLLLCRSRSMVILIHRSSASTLVHRQGPESPAAY